MRRSSLVSCLFVLIVIKFVANINGTQMSTDQTSLHHRLPGGSGPKKSECRYVKEKWEECDPTTGLQRRETRLKASSKSLNVDCEPVKYITRSCKKACRYTKGEWNACTNGERSRIDLLKPVSSSSNCESTRKVVKKCKPTCRYSKSDWSTCENGMKTKTLTLIDGEDCEPMKVVRKECETKENNNQKGNRRNKHKKQKGRKANQMNNQNNNNNNNNDDVNNNNSNINSNSSDV